jgi:hypothetical protein
MTLLDKLKADQLTARKNKDKDLAATLTTLYAEAVKVGKDDGNRETTDEEVIAVTKKFINNCIIILEKVTDPDAVAKAKAEIEVYNLYIPQQMSNPEIEKIITTIAAGNKPDLKSVMQYFKTHFAGRYNGKQVADIVKALQ